MEIGTPSVGPPRPLALRSCPRTLPEGRAAQQAACILRPPAPHPQQALGTLVADLAWGGRQAQGQDT